MTIDNANKLLSVITSTITEDDDYFTIEDENLQVFKETLLTAIDTMRKYQKIRTEIEQRLGTHGDVSLYNRAIHDVLDILDKYKSESEEK